MTIFLSINVIKPLPLTQKNQSEINVLKNQMNELKVIVGGLARKENTVKESKVLSTPKIIRPLGRPSDVPQAPRR